MSNKPEGPTRNEDPKITKSHSPQPLNKNKTEFMSYSAQHYSTSRQRKFFLEVFQNIILRSASLPYEYGRSTTAASLKRDNIKYLN